MCFILYLTTATIVCDHNKKFQKMKQNQNWIFLARTRQYIAIGLPIIGKREA